MWLVHITYNLIKEIVKWLTKRKKVHTMTKPASNQ